RGQGSADSARQQSSRQERWRRPAQARLAGWRFVKSDSSGYPGSSPPAVPHHGPTFGKERLRGNQVVGSADQGQRNPPRHRGPQPSQYPHAVGTIASPTPNLLLGGKYA